MPVHSHTTGQCTQVPLDALVKIRRTVSVETLSKLSVGKSTGTEPMSPSDGCENSGANAGRFWGNSQTFTAAAASVTDSACSIKAPATGDSILQYVVGAEAKE